MEYQRFTMIVEAAKTLKGSMEGTPGFQRVLMAV